jgi:XTP/dITP diphosphohydrolase
MPQDLTLATRNQHKLLEVQRILAPFGIAVQPLPAVVALGPETGETFESNARGKALIAAEVLKRPVLADDSGIEALALGGRPGVRSARFAGEHATDADNLAKLLSLAPAGSVLTYVCVLVYATGGGEHRVFYGRCRGRLAAAPQGAGGFGYDPAFLPDDIPGVHTIAELSAAEKDGISHRGRALRAFATWLIGGGRSAEIDRG